MEIATLINKSGEEERYGVIMIYTVNDDITYAALVKLDEDNEPLPVDVTLRICVENEDDLELFEINDRVLYNEALSGFCTIGEQL